MLEDTARNSERTQSCAVLLLILYNAEVELTGDRSLSLNSTFKAKLKDGTFIFFYKVKEELNLQCDRKSDREGQRQRETTRVTGSDSGYKQ